MEPLLQKVYTEVSQQLNDIHRKRKRALFLRKIVWIVGGLFLLLMLFRLIANYIPALKNLQIPFLEIFLANENNPYAGMYPIIALVAILYPSTYLFARAFQQQKEKENLVITKMVKMLFPKADFAMHTMAPTSEIMQSKLFAWIKKEAPIYSYGHLRSTIEGNIVNITDIGIIEENISNKTMGVLLKIPLLNMFVIVYKYAIKNILSNKAADNVYYTFRGMFCWLNFKKSLKGHTVVLTNNQTTKINRYFTTTFKEEEKITLEDPRFTDHFIVYSTDQVEARYMLTSAIMERIVALKEKFHQPILLSFQNNQMYLAVKSEHGLFSFSCATAKAKGDTRSEKLDTATIVEALANDIQTALEVAKDLKLTT